VTFVFVTLSSTFKHEHVIETVDLIKDEVFISFKAKNSKEDGAKLWNTLQEAICSIRSVKGNFIVI
jgi:hypothetical protein